MSKAVADAAADIARTDPEIVRRAAHTLLAKELRHQAAKEAIARKTIEILKEEATPERAQAPPEHPVDDDWLNVFTRFAEDASSERLQELWARVLAGQIRKPQAFSFQTLRFVAELDEHSASLFEQYGTRVCDGDFIPFPATEGLEFSELLSLEQFGLITLGAGLIHKTFDVPPGPFIIELASARLIAFNKVKQSIQIDAALLTRVGREIFEIIKVSANSDTARNFAEKFPKDGIERILFVSDGSPPIVLWQAPPDPSAV